MQLWLDDNGLCPGGYDIVERKVAMRGDYIADVIYYGRCR